MGAGIGNLGNIVDDFKESVNQIFGGSDNITEDKGELPENKKGISLWDPELGGSVEPQDFRKWTGNAVRPNQVRYGFGIADLSDISGKTLTDIYYLDIPPQSISQKEIFATNISSTRKGVIVESEGVVFKDIVIQGTTGVFPGPRGSSNNVQPSFKDLTAAPTSPAGVDPQYGTSKATGVSTISGYEEFLRLRQFFLRYAGEKVKFDGDRFLIFLNEKDDQALIVEPLEFTMDRSSKSPMTYNYRIVLKCIGHFDKVFDNPDAKAAGLSLFEQIGNISANVSAATSQCRAVINQSRRLVERVSQAIDQTFIGPLRQIQFAAEDLRDGLSTVFSLPNVLARNATEAVNQIRENGEGIGQSVNDFASGIKRAKADRNGKFSNSTVGNNVKITGSTAADSFSLARVVANSIENDTRVPVSRSAVEALRNSLRALADDIADFVNLGSTQYDEIQKRVVTSIPGELKIVSDNEFILLGVLETTIIALNQALATNNLFQADLETAIHQSTSIYQGFVDVRAPKNVREVKIIRGDTLERIALRELGSASRWVDLVVLNGLKAPFISAEGGDRVKKPGEKLLVGEK